MEVFLKSCFSSHLLILETTHSARRDRCTGPLKTLYAVMMCFSFLCSFVNQDMFTLEFQ